MTTWVNRWRFDIDAKYVKQSIDEIVTAVNYLQSRTKAWIKDENDFTIDDAEMFNEILNEMGFLTEHASKRIRKSSLGYTVIKEA